MAPELHTFDPDGDLLLILSKPAPEAAEGNTESSVDGTTNTPSESEAQWGSANTGAQIVVQDESVAGDAAGTSADSFDHLSMEVDGEPEEKEPEIVIHMLVSSKHMMLASPVFKAMLQHSTFKEGKKLSSAGKVEVPLPDDDPAPFKMVLDIIHGRNKQVPRKIDLDMLTKISIVVDKYQMTEGVQSYSEGWIEALREDLPTQYDTERNINFVHRWLGISWVFEKREEFKTMTQLVEQGCWANLVEDIEEGLPIPDLVIASILEKRQESLFELYGLIEQTIRRYQRPKILCPRTDDAGLRMQCDYLLLGSLLKSATTLGILPVPTSPYGEVSFCGVANKLRSLDVQAICDSIDRPLINKKYLKPAHGLKIIIDERIESLEERLSGLDIQDFKKSGNSIQPVFGV